jgi:hypothetical protein
MDVVDKDNDFRLSDEDGQSKSLELICDDPADGLGRLCKDRARSCSRSCSEAGRGNEEAERGSTTFFALGSASGGASSPDAALSDHDSSDSSAAASLALSDGADSAPPRSDVWTPGLDCGTWVLGKVAQRLSQGQVLVMNVYVNLRRIPGNVCRTVLDSLSHKGIRKNYIDWCAATLLGISRNMMRDTWRALGQNGHRLSEDDSRPEEAEQWSDRQAAEASGFSANASWFAFEVRVREAIHIAATGGTSVDLVAAVQRVRLVVLRLGTKYDHLAFMERKSST